MKTYLHPDKFENLPRGLSQEQKNMKDKYKKNYPPQRLPKYENTPKKQPPPANTYAETYYYKKQMDARTEMVFILQDGEEIEGIIEWYDKNTLKITRQDAPNILLFKHNIKYFFKAEEKEEA